MRNSHTLIAALGLIAVIGGPAFGQAGSQANQGPTSNMPLPPEQNDQQRFYRENVYGRRDAKQSTPAQKAVALQEVEAIRNSLPFACHVAEAAQVAAGPTTVNGQTIETKTFEIACESGMGYFVVAQPPEKPFGFTCFAAEATRAADVAQGKPPGIGCTLAANADLKAMAGKAMTRMGKSCTVGNLRWIGQNVKLGVEFLETACADGTGFVLKLPQPQSASLPVAVSCADAAKQGIACKLTDAGAPLLTVQTFKDALAQHKVACDATDVRVIGKETVRKRHVVEFQCAQQPKGLVALIPLADSTAPFQTMDCAAAARQKIDCKLTATQ